MFYVLDCWYKEELYKGGSNRKKRLLDILKDRLHALAQKIMSGSETDDMIEEVILLSRGDNYFEVNLSAKKNKD